jgi:hypothetical protein
LPKVEYLLKNNPPLVAIGSAFDEQIQENLNKSDFGFGALSRQFLGSDYITTKEMPYFLQKKSLFLFGLDKRINGNTLSVDDFFSKVNKKLNKDNTKILQEQVCYLDDGSGDFAFISHQHSFCTAIFVEE